MRAFRRSWACLPASNIHSPCFLDDLQWLDTATLKLIEHLVTHPDVRHLLLVGAFRDNELSAAHPLMRTFDALREMEAIVHHIELVRSRSRYNRARGGYAPLRTPGGRAALPA